MLKSGKRNAGPTGRYQPNPAKTSRKRSDFHRLQHFAAGASRICYFVFDLLIWNGRDPTKTPLTKRRELMKSVLKLRSSRIRISEQCDIARSEEHTSELQSRLHLVCRLLLEKKKILDSLIMLPSALPARPRGSAGLPRPALACRLLLAPPIQPHAADRAAQDIRTIARYTARG